MSRSRLVVLASMIVVGVGMVGALGAFVMDPARAAVGPLPAEGLSLPSDTRVVMGIDVQRFVASPFYKKYGGQQSPGRPAAFKELEEKTGVNPERDLDRVIVATRGTSAASKDGLVLVTGRFDRYKLSRAIETQPKQQVTWKDYHGTAVYLYGEGQKGTPGAVAFIEDDTLALGTQSAVESLIDSRLQNSRPLETNAPLLKMLATVPAGATFWMVGDQTALAHMPTSMPGPGAPNTSISLPSLQNVMVVGELDPVVSVQITGETADAAAAQNLADVVRGFVALANMQAQKPELKQLAAGLTVTTETTKVHVNARIPYELLDSLQAQAKAAARPVSSQVPAPAQVTP